MSYDLTIYYRREPSRALQDRYGNGYHIDVGDVDPIEPEDIDEDLFEELGACRYVSYVVIEGDYEAGYEALKPDLDAILADGGAIVDQEAGTITTQAGVVDMKWVEPEPPVEKATLSFFFEENAAFEADRFDTFMALMQEHLPEALPRRYGPHEPPRYSLERHGLDHFKAAWRNDPSLVWYAHKPFEHVFTSIPSDAREKKTYGRSLSVMGFRCSRIAIVGSAELATDRALSQRAEAFLVAAADLVGAFYAEMRLGESSVNSWWWKGLPPSPALCFALGQPYVRLWPEAARAGAPLGGGRVWLSRETQERLRLSPPTRLVQPPDKKLHGPASQPYAAKFPFPRPGTVIGDTQIMFRRLFGRRR